MRSDSSDRETKATTLVLFPFAGGAAHAFRPVLTKLPRDLSTMTLEAPGRGRRIGEKSLTDLHAIVDDFLEQLKGYPTESLVFYGHSMGAVVAYLLAHRLRDRGEGGPRSLIVSGRAGPTAPSRNGQILHTLSSEKLAEALASYGAIPEQILDDPELMAFFEPILRADFQAVESYRHVPLVPLNIPITLLIGSRDVVTTERALLWREESTAPLSVHHLEGGHFFIFDHPGEVAKILYQVAMGR